MKNICVIGSGSWGSALAIHGAKMGHNVKLWSFSKEEADLINNERKCKFLPQAIMPENIICTTNIKEAVEGSDMILHVTPSKFTRNVVKQYKEYIDNQPIILCSKGFEASTLYTLNEVVNEEIPGAKIGVFTGPSHAEEVSLGIPTAIVIASQSLDVQYLVQDTFMNENMRIYTSSDVKGAELGGALKNIIAFQTKRLNFEVCYSNPIYKENFANTFLSKSRTKSLELSYKFNLWIWNNRFTIR